MAVNAARAATQRRRRAGRADSDGLLGSADFFAPKAPSTFHEVESTCADASIRDPDRMRGNLRRRVALQALQVGANFRRVLIAVFGVFLETQLDDPGESRGNIGVQLRRHDRNLLHDRDQELSGGVSGEGRLAGTHLVEHDAEGKQVGALIERLAQGLLGRHVSRSAQSGAEAVGELELFGAGLWRVVGELFEGHHFRQTEVQDLGAAAPGHEDVGRLDIAMNDSSLMRGVEGVSDVDGELRGVFRAGAGLFESGSSGFRRRGIPWR